MRHWELRSRSGALLLSLNPAVFIGANVVIVTLLLLSIWQLEAVGAGAARIQTWIANRTGWLFVLTMNLVLAYLAYLVCSSRGNIRLGGAAARPRFSTGGWFTMLFSAGMGIGLVFYAVAEPMFHLSNPPHGNAPQSLAAYRDAMAVTFLHWGLHPWGVYALMGAAISYFGFSQRQGFTVRMLFYPLIGDRIYGWPGHIIDLLAVVATLFGVATSLGLGVLQITAGLHHAFGTGQTRALHLLLIAGITGMATISVVLGLDRGIRRLSNLNVFLAGLLLLFVVLAGPTQFIFDGLVQNIGQYLNDFFFLSFWTETYSEGHWQNGWTVFYWGWWIAWSPFVGIFLAHISYGRTLREFIVGVLLAATAATFLWLSAFGGSALYMQMHGVTDLAAAVQADIAGSLYQFLKYLPAVSDVHLPGWAGTGIALLATTVITTFFVTSSDSASLVIDSITAGGRPDPPVAQRVYWSALEGVAAAVLLVAGGLTALQTAAISAGFPFCLVLLLLIPSFHRALHRHQGDGGRA
jgi:choline/glycine/proline betaine transport protein